MKYQYSKSRIADYYSLATEMAVEIMAAEIEWDVIAKQLLKEGWTKVVLNSLKPTLGMKHSVDVVMWADENCVDLFVHNGRTWYFKSEKDATIFMLRWA